jgi:hypothetical protein
VFIGVHLWLESLNPAHRDMLKIVLRQPFPPIFKLYEDRFASA